MISKRYNAQMGNYLAKLAQEQNNLGTWQESIIKEYKTKQTNADRIRSMTDEELAAFMWVGCHNITEEACRRHAGCVDCWLDFLKQEVSANDS